MRLKKPIIAVSTVGLLALAACGGSNDGSGVGTQTFNSSGGAAGQGQDANRQPPAPEISGAQKLAFAHAGIWSNTWPFTSQFTRSREWRIGKCGAHSDDVAVAQ